MCLVAESSVWGRFLRINLKCNVSTLGHPDWLPDLPFAPAFMGYQAWKARSGINPVAPVPRGNSTPQLCDIVTMLLALLHISMTTRIVSLQKTLSCPTEDYTILEVCGASAPKLYTHMCCKLIAQLPCHVGSIPLMIRESYASQR